MMCELEDIWHRTPEERHSDELAQLRAEIARLTRENNRLCKSRNAWGQKYNKCLSNLRNAIFTDSEYAKAVDEKCAEILTRAEAAERQVEKLRELLRDARLGIAVLGDTTKHLGLQMGQDAAARIITAIDAALAETENKE